MQRNIKAFTLIELLVVIAIVGSLVAGIGLSLKGNNPGSALRAAQNTLIGTLSIARGQAALNQVDAMIVVRSDNAGSDSFLRSIQVVINTSVGWQAVGGEITLPQGVYVVPNNASITGVTLATTTGHHLSNFFTTSGPFTIKDKNGSTVTSGNFLQSGAITSLGSINGAGGYMLVAAGTMTSATTLTLENSAAVRGFIVSNYGVPTIVNESTTLDN